MNAIIYVDKQEYHICILVLKWSMFTITDVGCAFQIRLIFSLAPFRPKSQFACPWKGIQINTIVGGAVGLCFFWINHKQLQSIIRYRYFSCHQRCSCYGFKNTPAVLPRLFFFFLDLNKHPHHTPLCPRNVIFLPVRKDLMRRLEWLSMMK